MSSTDSLYVSEISPFRPHPLRVLGTPVETTGVGIEDDRSGIEDDGIVYPFTVVPAGNKRESNPFAVILAKAPKAGQAGIQVRRGGIRLLRIG